jgi:hypothetical protein
MLSAAQHAAIVAAAAPDATPEEASLVVLARSAISKVDNAGPRGIERITSAEIEAMVLLLIICGGPLLASAADHQAEEET